MIEQATTGPFTVGQKVRLANPRRLADDIWQYATGPTDANAALAIDLADPWPDEKPEVQVISVQPDLDGWYLTVQSPRLNGGDDFGVRSDDVEQTAHATAHGGPNAA